MVDLLVGRFLVQAHEEVRRAEVAVVLGDLELEDQVVAKGVPGELGDEAMVLVERRGRSGSGSGRGSKRALSSSKRSLTAAPSYGRKPSRNASIMISRRATLASIASALARASSAAVAVRAQHHPARLRGPA